jgi:hypothetical protein
MHHKEESRMDAMRGGLQAIPSSDAISRRVAARGLLGAGLVAAVLATTGRRHALGQSTPIAGPAPPTRYVLNGGGIDLVFVPAASAGAAKLDYRDAKATQTFTGDALIIETSKALGQLVSVLLESAPDGYDRYLTLLVPEVHPDKEGGDVAIHTVAIVTTHLTSIGGPDLVKGPLQTYEVIALDGTAEFGPP